MKEISIKTTVYTGEDALGHLATIANKKVFIVTDPFIVSSGMIEQVTSRLQQSVEHLVFSEITPDPPIETVVKGIDTMAEFAADIILAVGGGSAIDAAKAMKYFGETLRNLKGTQFIVIPTTSGTGSEVTNFSIITSADKGVKYPLVTNAILPDIAILETNLVKSVPPHITADTGMDVLTHALEAYVSTNANDVSDALAEKVVQLVFEYLPRAYKNGADMEAREKMHMASCMAGMAFNMASLGINHGIAHAAGAKLHIAHGRLNTVLMPAIIRYNSHIDEVQGVPANLAAERYAHLAKLLGLSITNRRVAVKNLVRAIEKLRQTLEMPATLKQCGVTVDTITALEVEIATAALVDGCTATNPRVPTNDEVVSILRHVL
ncbi:1-propanol dehydrogenase PduQ [Brochothrix thermosphacta]|uniref:1-propanol dehydrogenase PduQ n=1 Tax=Brochothrix thermosphacta TaxID=2756 RepID=UPI0039AF04AE